MSDIVTEYYNNNAEEFIERTIDADMSYCMDKFTAHISSDAYILDAGCGSGRDSLNFIKAGYRVCSIDASESMCKMASEHIGQQVECMRFEDMNFDNEFDGIWACASLLHVHKQELPEILQLFCNALKPGGIMYASFKYGDNEEERQGRFFADYHLEEITNIFAGITEFELVEAFETADVRPDHAEKPWLNVLVRKV